MDLKMLLKRLGFMDDPCASCGYYKCRRHMYDLECPENHKWWLYLTTTWRGRFLHIVVKLDSFYYEYKHWLLNCPFIRSRRMRKWLIRR